MPRSRTEPMPMTLTSLLGRRNAVPAAILAGAAAGFLLLAPQASPPNADEFSARMLRLAPAWELDDIADVAAHQSEDLSLHVERSLRTLVLMPHGEFIHYPSFDEHRRDALRAVLPCDDPERLRWWRDIDYQQPGLCGGAKCFFRSLCHPEEGYLVQAGAKEDSYDVAKELEEKYGIKHFYATPPFEAGRSTRQFVERLTGEYVAFYEGAEELEVQPMVAAPEGSTIVRCLGPRVKHLTGRLEEVLAGTDETAKDRLVGDLEHAVELTKAQPRLTNDFQLMVDPEGNVYHLDFDRMKKKRPTKAKLEVVEDCLEDAITFVKAVKNDDNDAKVKLREKEEEWEARHYGADKEANWKGHKFGFHLDW